MLNPLIEKYVCKEKRKEAYQRLLNGEAIQYIIGNVDFCGSIIKVDKRVLIPRFETETLVAKTIEMAKKLFSKRINVIDLGTGSGCIAIALKKALDCDILAIDISKEALDLARENASNNNVHITFELKDMQEKILDKYDIIISNPPYIPYEGYVEDMVVKNEPSLALFAKDNGLETFDTMENIYNILDMKNGIMNKIFKSVTI